MDEINGIIARLGIHATDLGFQANEALCGIELRRLAKLLKVQYQLLSQFDKPRGVTRGGNSLERGRRHVVKELISWCQSQPEYRNV